ncbi:uncharacterized protein N7500_006721 [Penicillium coprophilum]|uniref:uncharacterized protein n=1 Tax=Penicillium coprophilum TaxID=36646 RepID=UPI002399608E|nr:uncharacterized protein N7500_006721 [Penicillium coprophilum]KAJ5164891.1 hypothetical protein N7500_006721 [Penicillium coprophilum]
MFVNILPPPQRDPGQIVQIWQKVNQLVNILQTMPSAPSVWVSLLGDWSSGKIPQVSVTYTNGYNGYRPDHDIAIVPFTCLSDWHYRIPPSYSATIANERQLTKRSLLFKYGKDSVLEECQWGCVRAPDVNIVHDWLTDTRIFLDRRLDDIPGKTAGALRLERFQTWFQDSWASKYETQFISDLQKHQSTVLKHDRGLLGARRRHKLLIMLHHIYHASQDDPHKVEAALNEMTPRVYEKWDPQFWSECWGDGMPRLSFRLVEGRLDWQYWYRVYWSYRKFTVFGMILRGASSTTVTIRDAE